MENIKNEILLQQRFEFGANWKRFLTVLDDDRINLAVTSLKVMLGVNDLVGKSFLDIGSGSGLFSLAARRLGANVLSFDFDPESVACTAELKKRYYFDDNQWTIEEGSALNRDYLNGLGKFDIVYSWGVLHHTGDMWCALNNVVNLVKKSGLLFIAIYNDQDFVSQYWKIIKKIYVKYKLLRWPLLLIHFPYPFFSSWLFRFITGRLQNQRGMDGWYEILDWIGGFPYD